MTEDEKAVAEADEEASGKTLRQDRIAPRQRSLIPDIQYEIPCASHLVYEQSGDALTG